MWHTLVTPPTGWRFGRPIAALRSGLIVDAVGLEASIHVVAALPLLSGGVVGWAMREPGPARARLVTR